MSRPGSRIRMILISLLCGVCLLGIAGCAPGYGARGHAGPVDSAELGQSDRDSCIHSCNASFDRCSDTAAAQRPISPDVPADLFGARSSCRDALRDCLPRCNGR